MIFLVVFLVTLLIYFYKSLWKKRYLLYYSCSFEGPVALPFFGSAYVLLEAKKDNVKFLNNLFAKYGSICKLWLGHILVIFTNNPNYVEIILNECLEKETAYNFGKCIIGDGIFTSSTKKWKKHRKIIALLFNTKKLNSFIDIFIHESNLLIQKLEAKVGTCQFDAFPIIQKYTIDIICRIALGNKNHNEKYGYWMLRVETLVFLRFFLFYLHPDFVWKLTRRYREVKILTRKTWKFVKEIVEQKSIDTNNNNVKLNTNCFLDDLLTIPKHTFTKSELIEEIQTLIVAGSGTTSTTEATALLMLALHQEVQEKVYAELCEIFGGSDRKINFEDLSQMKYLECVIKETLRLFPAAPAFARTVQKDLRLNNSLVIPQGASVIIPIISVHRNEAIWKDALKFQPERFMNVFEKKHPCAFIPFAAGPRNCIGIRYAMMALKIMLATVVRRFRIVSTSYKSLEDIPLHFKIITKFPKGHMIELEVRN